MSKKNDSKTVWGSPDVLNNSFTDIMAEQIQEVIF